MKMKMRVAWREVSGDHEEGDVMMTKMLTQPPIPTSSSHLCAPLNLVTRSNLMDNVVKSCESVTML